VVREDAGLLDAELPLGHEPVVRCRLGYRPGPV